MDAQPCPISSWKRRDQRSGILDRDWRPHSIRAGHAIETPVVQAGVAEIATRFTEALGQGEGDNRPATR